MSYAQASDVAARLGRPLSTAESAWVPSLLDDVEAMITTRIPDLDDRISATPPTIDQATVIRVESWVVVRFLKNPDGKLQESIDDYSFTRDRAVSAGTLALTDEEWDQILPSTGTSSAFTIQSVANPVCVAPWRPWSPWDWC